eukprot:scaffold53724_cov36-Tisochrysis_lutea.AAC.3
MDGGVGESEPPLALLALPCEIISAILDTAFGPAGAFDFAAIGCAGATCRALHVATCDEGLWRRIALKCGADKWSSLALTLAPHYHRVSPLASTWREEVLSRRRQAFGLLTTATDAAAAVISVAANAMPSASTHPGPVVITSDARFTPTPGLKRAEYCAAVQSVQDLLMSCDDCKADLAWSFLFDWLHSRVPTKEPLRALVIADVILGVSHPGTQPASRLDYKREVSMRSEALERVVELHVFSFSQRRDCRGFRARDERTILSASIAQLLNDQTNEIWSALARGVMLEVTNMVLRCD